MEQIQAMESVRVYMELECPSFFLDKGHWTGVRVKDVLALAGVSADAREVKFVALDGSYYSRLSLDLIDSGDVLLAYRFEDKEFPPYHGYPLRVAAKDQPGSRWVKWLGGIEVLE
jgi:DMSO/TMAO reductase YedYZ molybdopterin-dependent catalytic subunit